MGHQGLVLWMEAGEKGFFHLFIQLAFPVHVAVMLTQVGMQLREAGEKVYHRLGVGLGDVGQTGVQLVERNGTPVYCVQDTQDPFE